MYKQIVILEPIEQNHAVYRKTIPGESLCLGVLQLYAIMHYNRAITISLNNIKNKLATIVTSCNQVSNIIQRRCSFPFMKIRFLLKQHTFNNKIMWWWFAPFLYFRGGMICTEQKFFFYFLLTLKHNGQIYLKKVLFLEIIYFIVNYVCILIA